jgi:tellurite resistance protein
MKAVTPTARAGLFRRTPPAVFPPLMGLLGLGLAWRPGVVVFGFPPGLAELCLGAVTLVFLFAFAAYLFKVLRRPASLADDLRILPGRAGCAALVLSLYLQAMVFAPHAPELAALTLWVAFAAHILLVAVFAWVLSHGPAEQARVSPVWHLVFAGFIVGALAAVQQGHDLVAVTLLGATALAAVAIWAVSVDQLSKTTVPAPLRPLLMIHLSPAALFGLVAAQLGLTTLALGFAVATAALLLVLVLRANWLTAAGFSPLWGAFTFPLAATANLWLTLDGGWRVPGALVLVAATLVIPPITVRVLRLWARGSLSVMTNAASA